MYEIRHKRRNLQVHVFYSRHLCIPSFVHTNRLRLPWATHCNILAPFAAELNDQRPADLGSKDSLTDSSC